MSARRRFLAAEVIQTSAMDCGPASLNCLLEGFGIHASYGRLREACQTDVDGTSIDTLEEVAVQLGLDAEQVMLPADHVLLDEARALPALVAVQLPSKVTHFVVAWRRHGPLVQVMDPATGRRWVTRDRFLRELYIHTMPVSAAAWRAWAGTGGFMRPLRRRMSRLGVPDHVAERHLDRALSDPGWRGPAALDAAVRMAASLLKSGGLAGVELHRMLELVFDGARRDEAQIPRAFWSVSSLPPDEDGEERLELRGAVLLQVRGRREDAVPGDEERPALPPELAAALTEPPARPARELFRLLRRDGALAPAALLLCIAAAGVATLLEAVLLRSLFDLSTPLRLGRQRLVAALALGGFLALLLALELPIQAALQRLGRGLEARLRAAFLAKLPRLGLRYFQSRPASDMTERGHSVHRLRAVPELAGQVLRALAGLFATAAGIVWIAPGAAVPTLGMAALAAGLPLAFQVWLAERDLRFRTHGGALTRFYLDALLGLVPIRTHAAERAVRCEHEGLLVEWFHAGRGLLRLTLVVEGLGALVGLGFAAWLLLAYVGHGGDRRGLLLVVYWALQMPVLSQRFALALRQYAPYRNVTLRLLEPLGAPEEGEPVGSEAAGEPRGGIRVRLRDVTVRAGGHTVLEVPSLEVAPGAHVAIVGASGAGKSSLVGLLLGFHRLTTGAVEIDGRPLGPDTLAALRAATAWVDPAVHLWNRTLLDNLLYGSPWDESAPIGRALDGADLRGLVDRLPDGLQTVLGEGGALVSGGEGQRLRFGRGLLRPGVRLAVLDEPFRGLDRERRRALLDGARRWWQGATLLCVTHDVEETLDFPRVLVIDGGRVVEDGAPEALAADPDSRYRRLLDADRELRRGLWTSAVWRRLRLQKGRLHQDRLHQDPAERAE